MTDLDELLAGEQEEPRRSRVGGVLVLLSLVAAAVAALYLVLGNLDTGAPENLQAEELDYPGPASTQATVIEVSEGQTLTEIGETLQEAGVIRTVQAFTLLAQYSDEAQRIQPGYYTVHLYQTGESALAELLSPQSREGQVVVPEGLTVDQTYQLLSQATGQPVGDLKEAGAALTAEGLPLEAESLEGLLAPGRYDFAPDSAARKLLEVMLGRFEKEVLPLLGEDGYEALIVASIVEEEAGIPEDRGKVARVVYNRLEDGMRLQMDSTINYARGDSKAHLSEEDLELQSVYNTYRREGLPPTPISTPSEGAVQAAVNPPEGDWVYFVASGGGGSTFTVSYEEFLQAKERAQAEGVY